MQHRATAAGRVCGRVKAALSGTAGAGCLAAASAALSLGFGGVSATAAAASDKLTFVVFGDSITRATIADKTLGQTGTQADIDSFARFGEIAPFYPYSPEGQGILNYSLMGAFSFVTRDQLAAVQGDQPYSLATRIKATTGREVDVIKAAHLGGTFREGDPQLAVFAQGLADRGLKEADLAYVDLGRGDFSLYSDVEAFRFQVEHFLAGLYAISPHIRVIVNRIPNEVQVLNRPDRLALRLPDPDHDGEYKDLPCSALLKQTVTLSGTGLNVGTDNSKVLAAATHEYDALNEVLAATVARYQAAGAVISMVDILPDRQNPEDWDRVFAYDCVHINTTGQKEIADHLLPVVTQLLAQPAKAPVLPVPAPAPAGSFLTSTGQDIWREYVASFAAADLQPGCKPDLEPPQPGTAYRGVAFLIHGFSACPEQMGELAAKLRAEGYAVVMPLLPGHGRMSLGRGPEGDTEDDLAALPSPRLQDKNNFEVAYNNLAEVIDLLAPEFAGEHVIAGVSLGAAVATAATKLHPARWDRQLLMSPFYKLTDSFQAATFGFIATLGRQDKSWWQVFGPLIDQRISWGESCIHDRAAGRHGYCQFTIGQVIAAAEFGYETWQLVQPTTLKTQVVAVQEDSHVAAAPVFTAVGTMRVESLGKEPYQTAERFDAHPNVRVCYMPSHQDLCDSNAGKALSNQAKPCVSHSLIASGDDVQLDHYWLQDFTSDSVRFLTSGVPLPQVTDDRYAGDPMCAGFSRG